MQAQVQDAPKSRTLSSGQLVKLLSLFLLSFLVLSADAATITGTIVDNSGTPSRGGVIKFLPTSNPGTVSSAAVSGIQKTVNLHATNGTFSTSLLTGNYLVTAPGGFQFNISVPAGSGTYDITEIASGLYTFPWAGVVRANAADTNASYLTAKMVEGQGVALNVVTNDDVIQLEFAITDAVYTNNASLKLDRSSGIATNLTAKGVFEKILGAVGNGIADDTDALEDAMAAVVSNQGGGEMRVPPGTYKISRDLNIPNGVKLILADDAIIDGTGGTFTNAVVALTGGSLTELPSLASAIVKGSRTIEFDDDPGLQPGDVIYIWDSTDYSFNLARAEARAGEAFRVMTVSGNTVTTTTPAYADYATGAARKLYLLNAVRGGMRGGKIIAPSGVTLPCLEVEFGDGVTIENVEATGSRYAGFYVNRSFEVTLRENRARDFQATVGNNYGVAVGNSQRVKIIGGHYFGLRHGVTFGGGTDDGSIVCRDIELIGVTAESEGTSSGLDFHPQCEFYTVNGGSFLNGIQFSGNNGTLVNATVGNDQLDERCFVWAEVNGKSWNISNNKFIAIRELDSGDGLLELAARSYQVLPGWTQIHNNTFEFGDVTWDGYPTGSAAAILVQQASGSTNNDHNISIKGNIMSANATNAATFYGIRIQTVVTQGFDRVVIEGNELHRLAMRLDGNVKERIVKGNQIFDAPTRGIYAPIVASGSEGQLTIAVTDNYIEGAYGAGILLIGATNDFAAVDGNYLVDVARANAGAPEDSGVYVVGFQGPVIQRNKFLDTATTNLMNNTVYVEDPFNGEVRYGLNENLSYTWNTTVMGLSTVGVTDIRGPTIRDKQMRWDLTPLSSLGEIELTANSGTWFRFGLVANANNGVVHWDDTHRTLAIGGTAATANTLPFQVLSATNASIQSLGWNNLNNTAAIYTWTARGGTTGNSGSAGLFGAADSYSTDAHLAGKGGVRSFSDSAALLLEASTGTAHQFYDGSTLVGDRPGGGSLWRFGSVQVADDAYAAGWNGSTNVPTKNAIYDKIESLTGVTDGDKGDITVSGSGATWAIDDNVVDGANIAIASQAAGDIMYYDGTDWVRLAKGTAGQVLEMNAGATAPEWDTDDNSGSATAFNDIGDTSGNGSVALGHTNIWTFSLDGSRALQILASDTDKAADTTILTLADNDSGDANSVFLDVIDDADGTPTSIFKVTGTGLTTTLPTSIGTGNGSVLIGSAGVLLESDGDGALSLTGQGDGSDENVTINLDDTSNTATVTSTTSLNKIAFSSIDLEVPTEVYDATGWNGDNTVPTKDAVRDKIESLTGVATAWTDIGDATGDTAIALGAHETDFTSTIDAAGEAVITILNEDADAANDNVILDLRHNDGADANVVYLRMVGDNDGTPSSDFVFSQSGFSSLLPVVVPAEAFSSGWNGDGGAPQKDGVYDWGHLFDTDDDGFVNIIDSGGVEFDGTTDTTLTRSSAGNVAIEGNVVARQGHTLGGEVSATFESDGSTAVTIADSVTVATWTMTGAPGLAVNNGATGPGAIQYAEDSDNGSNYVEVKPPSALGGNRTMTLADGDTFIPIIPQVLTISGPTAARTITVPDANFTAARTDAANTFTGIQTFSSAPVFSSTTASQALLVDSGKALTSVAYTGSGNVMRTRTGVERSIWIPAGAFTPGATNGAATGTLVAGSSTNYVTRDVFDFDDSTPERVEFDVTFQHAFNFSTIKYQVHFYSGQTSGTAEFGLMAKSVADNESDDVAWGTMVTVSKAVSGTANRRNITSVSSALTIATTPAAGENVPFVLWRVTTDTAVDNLTGDARVSGIMLFYTETATEPSAP